MGCGSSTAGKPVAADGLPGSASDGRNLRSSNAPVSGQVVFVFGHDVSGRDAICAKLCEELGCHHLVLGAMLKDEVTAETSLGLDMAGMIRQGKIVPSSHYAQLVRQAMLGSPGGTFLVEGHPKSVEALNSFKEQVGVGCAMAVLFDLPDDAVRSRLAAAGEAEDGIGRKMRSYSTQTLPVVRQLESQNLLHRFDVQEGQAAALDHTKALLQRLMSASSAPGRAAAAEAAPTPTPRFTPSGPVIFVFGGPGAGKATQCSMLAQKYECVHLHTAELLRAEVKEASELGRKIADMIKEGKIVPAQVTLDLLKEAMVRCPGRPYLVDGFPRSLDNLASFEGQLGPCMRAISFETSEEQMTDRLGSRLQAMGRPDDQPEAVARRIRTFKNQTMPVVEELGKRELVDHLDSSGDAGDIFDKVCEIYERHAA